jgi:hypothetical protein
MSAAPDQPLEARVGDVRLLPGECVRAPDGTGGHTVRVVITDGRGEKRSRLVWAPRGRRTYLEVRGRVKVRRQGCDQRLPADDGD